MREQHPRGGIIPLKLSFARRGRLQRLGIGAQPRSIIEFYYRNDQLGDPMVSEGTSPLRMATAEIDDIMALAIRVNDSSPACSSASASVCRLQDGDRAAVKNELMRIVVADEISPFLRLWDIKSNEKLDRTASARSRRAAGATEVANGSAS